jgi:hypothetical protein
VASDGGVEAGTGSTADGGLEPVPSQISYRYVVGANANNVPVLAQAMCCFHHQAGFKVRTGGEWVVLGSENLGFLHHVFADPSSGNRCVLSCDPRSALMNGRAFEVPWTESQSCTVADAFAIPSSGSDAGVAPSPTFDRNSPLAFRNPMFSFVMWAGCGPFVNPGDHTLNGRDMSWHFTVGQPFTPLTIGLASAGTPVSPRSLRYIDSLGQIALVDGASQGLVVYDLTSLSMARGPFY